MFKWAHSEQSHCVKSVRIWSFSGLYLPVFSPNTGKYGPENPRIRTLFMQSPSAISGKLRKDTSAER